MATKPCENCGKEVKQRYASKYETNRWLCFECKEEEIEPEYLISLKEELNNIILTTTSGIYGKKVVQYLEIISAEVIEGLSLFQDFGAGISDVFGGTATGYRKALSRMKTEAFNIIRKKAHELGANAVIGIDLDYGDLKGSMLMLVVNGTAVIIE